MLVTVAIPCYKSAKTLPHVVADIQNQFSLHKEYEYQLVLVNDGSPDQNATFQTIETLCREDPRIVGVELSKNFGQAAAKMAALRYVQGDVLVYMDDDGQHDARGIFPLVQAVEAGADMAIAEFHGKKHTLFKRFTSWLNTEMLCLTLQKPKNIHTSSFAAYSKFLIERLKEYDTPFVSMFGYVLQHTRKIVNVQLEHHERLEGQSGYTLKKLLKLWSDGIFSFSTVPLRMIEVFGVASCAVSLVMWICAIVIAVMGKAAAVWAVLGAMFFLGGCIFFAHSILGAYIGRMFLIQCEQPQYAVRTVLNYEREGAQA